MFGWLYDLYLLLTAKIPPPRTAMIIAVVALTTHLMMLPWEKELLEMGFFAPVIAYLCGHFFAFSVNLPNAATKVNGRAVLAAWLSFVTVLVLSPTLEWAQHAISIGFILQTIAFGVLFHFGGEDNQPLWFAQNWSIGKQNAANWYITRGLAMVLLNEILIADRNPTEWIVGLCLGAIALHYLMFWTVLATHPFEDE